MPTVSTKGAGGMRSYGPSRIKQPRPPGLLQGPKDYTKSALQFDPTLYGNFSFGRTGLTGES